MPYGITNLALFILLVVPSAALALPIPKDLCGKPIADARLYDARLMRVVDGDTQDVVLDLGFRLGMQSRLRLIGVDTPEKHTATRAAGEKASKFSADWWSAQSGLAVVAVVGTGKFGRPLAHIVGKDGKTLNRALLESGNATYYCGGRKAQ